MADQSRLLALGRMAAAMLAVLPALPVRAQTAERLPGVTVAGRADPREEPTSSPEFGGLPLGELPVSISVLRARDLRNAGADSLSEAIRREPAASDAYNTVGYVETIQLRGFLLDPLLNYRRNGLPVSTYTPYSLVTKQQVDIQKGLNGVVTGPSSPGGTVNYITKRATVDITEASLDLSERGTWLAAIDVGRRAGDDFGWRINAAQGQRRPAARDADGEQSVLGLAIDWRGPRGIRADAEFEVHNARQISVPGLGLVDRDGDGVAETVPPARVLGDPRINLNNQPWSQPFDSRSQVGTARLALPLAERWTLTFSGLLQRTRINDRLAFPDGCSSGPAYVYPGLCGNYDVDLYDYRSENERRNTRVLDVALDGQVRFGGMTHRLRVAPRTTRYSERFDPYQLYYYVGTINALAPVPLPAAAATSIDPVADGLTSPNTLRDLRIDDMQLSDTVDLTERWRLFFGARLVRYQAASWRTDGTAETRFTQSTATPWLALSWRVAPAHLLYASFNQGFEPDAVPNRPTRFVNAGQVLQIKRSRQAEVGWRGTPGPGQSASVALFDVRRPQFDDRTVPANTLGATTERVSGAREAVHRGVELDWWWQFARQWSLGAHAMLLDAKIVRSVDPAVVGREPTNVPKSSGALQLDWRRAGPDGIAVSNRVYRSGARAITADNGVTLPSWWQWDTWLTLPARIGGLDMQWRAGVENVTDRRFWREAPTQSWGGTYLFPAQPRTYRVGVSVRL